jgi:hypothetical protein
MDNSITIMHEGASGGARAKWLEEIHRELDGRILLARNLVTQEKTYIELTETCELRPVTDDMALCHPSCRTRAKKWL